jgi:hypothetical protein
MTAIILTAQALAVAVTLGSVLGSIAKIVAALS